MGLLIPREELLKTCFDLEDNYPQWACPTCKQSLLVIDDNSFQCKQMALSRRESNHYISIGESDPILYENSNDSVFITILVCSNKQCEEFVSCCGNVSVYIDYSKYNPDTGGSGWNHNLLTPEYHPKYFYPHLCLFKIPELCPDSVKRAIEESFATFFSSITATTNSIRISIEALLREHKISSKNERSRFIPLHRGIKNISETSELYPFKDQLLTLKDMGNDGSHNESEVSKEDIVDAYEVLSDILEKRYPEKKDTSASLKRLNDKFKRKS